MAFDHPLEADRVDDLNFFSTIIRAPVVGALFWFLGGEEAKQREEEDKRLRSQLFGKGSDELDDDSWRSASSRSSSGSADNPLRPRRPTLKKGAPPSMAESEVSSAPSIASSSAAAGTAGDDRIEQCGESLDRLTLGERQSAAAAASSSLKRKKELSWSDESGHDLVQYMEAASRQEGSAVRISDRPSEHNQHPSRQSSGISRSRSVRANMVTDDAARHGPSEPSRYLPRGLDKAHNGIVMPRMPYGTQIDQASSGDGGVESPQWGWFLRTTPPTPQMYYPRAPASVQRHATATSGIPPTFGVTAAADPSLPAAVPASFATSVTDSSLLPASHPNPVFQGLQDKHQAAGMGWSSVPL